MSRLYGRIHADMSKTTATKRGNKFIVSQLETWEFMVRTELLTDGKDKDVEYIVDLRDKEGHFIKKLAHGYIKG